MSSSPSPVIAVGQSVSIIWTSTNAQSGSISGIGNVSLVGAQTVTPLQTTTYYGNFTGQNNLSTNCQVTITVIQAKLNIENDTSVSIPRSVAAGSTNNNLFGFKITTDSSQPISFAGTNIVVSDTIFNNSNGATSFKNFTLWQGTIKISGPIQMNIASEGAGNIVFPIDSSANITVKNDAALSLQVHGDVNSLDSSAIALNSTHSLVLAGSSVTGLFQYQTYQVNINASGNVFGPPIVVLPYHAKFSVMGAGNNNNTVANLRNTQLNDKIATITVGTDSIAGGASINTIYLRFSGSGLFNQFYPSHIGTFPVNLLNAGGTIVDTQQCVPVTTILQYNSSTGIWTGRSCSILFPLNIALASGGAATYTLQTPNPVIQKPGSGGNGEYQNVLLFLDDVVWTDGTTPNIHWNSSNPPLGIFNYTYQ